MNQIIGIWDDVILYKLAADLIDCTEDSDRIKVFIVYIKQYSESASDLLDVATYYYKHLEESFRKLLILI